MTGNDSTNVNVSSINVIELMRVFFQVKTFRQNAQPPQRDRATCHDNKFVPRFTGYES